MRIRRGTLLGYGLTAVYVLVAVVAVLRDYRPSSETPDGTGYSTAKARKHLEVIAREPHPSGTPANVAVRRYIMNEARRLGVRVESIPRFTVHTGFPHVHVGGNIRNVVARIPGSPGRETLLVMAHFDSRPFAKGANDDGAAVAAMLESIRIMRRGTPPRNNIIFLFTDGEELGLLGARAFRRFSRFAGDPKLVLNFESRGRTGSSLLFETSRADRALIRAFARRGSHPVGTSLAANIYRLMPNDTDFSVFRDAEIRGLNFAYMGDVSVYHSMLDDVNSLDDKSMRHQGRMMVNLVRAFSERDLSKPVSREWEPVFFNLDRWLVHYSGFTSIVLVVLTLIAWAVCIGFGLRGRFISAGSVGRGMAITGVGMPASGLLVFGVRALVNMAHPDYAFMAHGDTYNVGWYRVAYAVLAAVISLAVYAKFRGDAGMAGPFLGGLTWFAIFTIVCLFLLPGAAYLFQWPLLIACGFLLTAAVQEDRETSTAVTFALYVLFTCLWVYVFAWTMRTSMQGFTLRGIALLAPLMAPALVPLFPIMDIMRLSLRPILYTGVLVSFACLGMGSISAGFDKEHPRPDSLALALKHSTGEAFWISCDAAPDQWTRRFLGAEPPHASVTDLLPVFKLCPTTMREPLRVPARHSVKLSGPRASVIRDRFHGGTRTVRLRVRSTRGAGNVHVFIDRRELEIVSAKVNGLELHGKKHPPKIGYGFIKRFVDIENWESFLMYAVPRTGYTLELAVRGKTDRKTRPVLKLTVADQSMGLGRAGIRVPPRPADIMPSSTPPLHDSVLVSRKFEFR